MGSVLGGFFDAFTGASRCDCIGRAGYFRSGTGLYSTTAANNQNIGGMSGLSVASINHALQLSSVGSGSSSGTFATVNFSSYANQSTLSGILTNAAAGSLSSTGTGNPLKPTGSSALSSVNDIGVTGGNAAWQAPTGNGFCIDYFPTATTTDYQVVSMALGSLGSYSGEVMLIGRSSSDVSTCVIGYLNQAFAYLGCFVGGSWTLLDSTAHNQVAGALYELVCGNEPSSNIYEYQLLCNGTALISLTDSSHISQVGSSYRYAALGQANYVGTAYTNGGIAYAPNTQVNPPAVSQWGIADNAPPAVIGSGFLTYRASTSGVTISNGGPFPLGSGCFDTVEWNTPDLTYNSSTNVITVGVTAWYAVGVRLLPSNGANFLPVIYHNGSIPPGGMGGSYNDAAYFSVYCVAGDTLQSGYSNGPNASILGSSSTLGTSYWSVTLSNAGTLS